MIIPATSPVMTEHDSPIQLLMPSRYNIPNVAKAINTALTFTPTPNDCSSSRIEAPSRVRTRNMPIIESRMPVAAISIGASTAFTCSDSPIEAKAAAPSAAVARTAPQ